MLAVVAEGRNPARNDTAVDGASRGKPVVCQLTEETLQELLQPSSSERADGVENVPNFTKSMRGSLDTVTKLSREAVAASGASREGTPLAHPAKLHCLDILTAARKEETRTAPAAEAASVEVYRQSWEASYEDWKQAVLAAPKRPNEKQWQCLDLVHRRCVYEYTEEVSHRINATPGDRHWEPLFRMVHGLPGAGKSELLKWLRTYFETVWLWTSGVQFQFLAPMNQMAHGIGGETLHSFGGIRFQNAEGTTVNPGAAHLGKDKVSKMVVKCKDLRFVFIDEFEAVGVRLAADFEGSLFNGVPTKNSYRFHSPHGHLKQRGHLPRGFAGVNVFFLGDVSDD
jgi:hypothetical protein